MSGKATVPISDEKHAARECRLKADERRDDLVARHLRPRKAEGEEEVVVVVVMRD
jgi:hypothetical protein